MPPRYDPRYQFLRDLHAASPAEGHTFGGGAVAGGGKDSGAFLSAKETGQRLGRAGPVGGGWWWEARGKAKDAGSFAREMLRELDDEQGEHSEFMRTWHAAMFEVPEKRIRTVHWPLTDGGMA